MTTYAAPENALPLPLQPADITAKWLTAALRQRNPSITVTSAEVVDVILGTSTKIRVRLTVTGEGTEAFPKTVIVKGGFEEHSRVLGPMYANEIRFYSDIQPYVTLPSPICYFAGSDPNSYQSIVIMEDLRRDGVIFCDALKPQSFEQIGRRLEALGRYHAETWASPEFQPGRRWASVAGRFEAFGLEFMYRYLKPEVWAHYMASPRGAATSVAFHDRDWMERALLQLAEIQKTQPQCLIHGDTHLGNLYIYEDGTPGFFDAQVARGAWHHEISYHVICASDLADRKRWEKALLERYLAALAKHGAAAPSFEQAWLDYRRSIAWGLFIFLTNEIRFQTESVNTAYAARFSQAALDHDLKALLP